MYLFHYISTLRFLHTELKKQKKYNQSFLTPYLESLEIKYGGEFGSKQKQRIQQSTLGIVPFLLSTFKALYGKTLTDAERKRGTLFAVVTPLGDDLFDIEKTNHTSIKDITFTPDTYNAVNFFEHIVKEIQSFLLQNVPRKDEYIKACSAVLKAQEDSRMQANADITKEELERITYAKGVTSFIISHQHLDEAADEQTQELLFLIGSAVQLIDDIFDIYEDTRTHIYTLANTCKSCKDLKERLFEHNKLLNQKITALSYAKKNKETFRVIANAITAIGLVALDKFIALEIKKGVPVNWWQQERKDMIVDMEKPANLIKWLYYTWKLPRII